MIMLKKHIHKLVIVSLLLCASVTSVAGNDWIYIIKKGDNLWDLAEKYLVDMRYWRPLQRLNSVTDATHMSPGSKLRIPLKWMRIQSSEAAVKNVSGSVFVTMADSGKKRKVKAGMILNVGDEILTESKSSVTLTFGDGSILTLREKSDLTLETLDSYGNGAVFNSRLKLNRGRSDNKVNPFKKPGSRFEINTPSATAAVRGTVYRVSVPDPTTTTSEVLKGSVSVSNQRGKALVPGGFGTVAKQDEAPSTPVVLLPAPDLSELSDLVEHLPIRFTLPEIKNAMSYRVQLSSEPLFQSLKYDQVTSTPSAKIAELADGKYLVRVRGIDGNHLEGFGSVHSFVLNAKPEAPFPVIPQPEAAVPVEHREFSWSGSKDISSYHFQLADNSDFNLPAVDITDTKGTTVDATLIPGKWFWRVAAIDPVEGSGPFGAYNAFRVMKPGPVAEPAKLNDADIMFRWPSGEEGDRYQIQIAREDTFKVSLIDEQILEARYAMPRPKRPGNIYMRVKLIDPDGFEGSWGAPQHLEIPDDRPFWLLVGLPYLLFLL